MWKKIIYVSIVVLLILIDVAVILGVAVDIKYRLGGNFDCVKIEEVYVLYDKFVYLLAANFIVLLILLILKKRTISTKSN